MIQQLSAQNLNGRTFTHPLSSLQIFVGNNAVGKSTIHDALKLVTLGAVPGFASTNPAIMENYGTGPSLSVAIVTAKGSFSRKWTRSGKSIKSDSTGDEAIVEALKPAVLNGEAFFAAKAPARANMLRAAFPSADDPKQAVKDAMREANLDGFHMPDEADLTFDAWVDKWLEDLAEAAKGHRANVKRMKGTIQGLSLLDADALTSNVTKEEIAAAREILAEKSRLFGAAGRAYETVVVPPEPTRPARSVEKLTELFDASTRRRSELAAQLQQGEQGHKNAKRAYLEWLTASEQHTAAASALEKATLEGKEEEITLENCDKIIESTRDIPQAVIENEEKYRLAKQLADQLKSRAESTQAAYDALKLTTSNACDCATCGAAPEHWKADIRALAEQRLTEARDAAIAAARKSLEADETLKTTGEKLEKQKGFAKLRTLAIAIRESFTRLEQHPAPGEAPVKPAEDFDSEALDAAIYELDCELEELRDDLAAWSAVELFEQRQKDKAATGKILEDARADEAGALQEVQRLSTLFDAAVAARETQAKQEAATAELAKSEEDLGKCETAAEIVKASAAKEAEKVLKPLLDLVNIFTAGIMKPGLSHVGLDIGRWHNETQWQPLARLSGAEKAMVIAALSAALATQGSRVVVIDEFSVIDDAWKPLFLGNLAAAKEAGKIDQAIVLDNRGHDTPAPGWSVLKL